MIETVEIRLGHLNKLPSLRLTCKLWKSVFAKMTRQVLNGKKNSKSTLRFGVCTTSSQKLFAMA